MKDVLELKPNIIIGDNYQGQITLTAWQGFQSRQGVYGSKNSNDVLNGLVKIFISGRQIDYVKITTQAQINSLAFLIKNAEKIRDEILIALFKELPNIKETYDDLCPEIQNIADFKNVLGLSMIHLLESEKDGFAYTGYELGCDWDDEHGIGVMMHKDRVVAIGQADTAFNAWLTYRDNGTENDQQENWSTNNLIAVVQNKIETKKTWWKF